MEYLPIIYREFYDIPRAFLVNYQEQFLLFDSPFNESEDDYSGFYTVYLMPQLSTQQIEGSWSMLPSLALKTMGRVEVSDVKFDKSYRKCVASSILELLDL